MHGRIACAGLFAEREATQVLTLGDLLTRFFETTDVKESTRTRMKQAERAILRCFGQEYDPNAITPRAAEDWFAELKKPYATATAARTLKYAKQFFCWGVKRGLASSNPFENLKSGSQSNVARQVFIDRETIECVIDAAPSAEWRLLIALAGVNPWPRTWHNLRASRQTELANQYPLHTVCSWIGNSKLIEAAHYLQVTDADWQRAVGEAEQATSRGAKCGAMSVRVRLHCFAAWLRNIGKTRSKATWCE